MTAPVAHGYPDWGRYAAWSDKVYDNLVVADIDAQTDYGPYFVGDVRYIRWQGAATTNHFRMQLEFFEDAAMAVFMERHNVEVRQGLDFGFGVPVLGPWMRLRAIPTAANSAFTAQLASTSHPGGWLAGIPTYTQMISTIAAAIGAGATITTMSSRIRSVPAIWSVRCIAATWDAFLEMVEANGTVLVLDSITQAQNQVPRPVYLPPGPIQIRTVNTTGAGSTVSQHLSAPLLWGA